MITRIKRIGILLALTSCAVLLWRGLIIFAAVVAIIAAAAYLGYVWRQSLAVRRFRAAWQSQGRDLLLVYSNSPNWKRYVEETWLPRWGNRAVVLNWSERQTWRLDRQPEKLVSTLLRNVAPSESYYSSPPDEECRQPTSMDVEYLSPRAPRLPHRSHVLAVNSCFNC